MRFDGEPLPGFADELRALARRYTDDAESLKLRAVFLLMAYLFEQGWKVRSNDEGIIFRPPGLIGEGAETVDEVKARVRRTLQAARPRQLAARQSTRLDSSHSCAPRMPSPACK